MFKGILSKITALVTTTKTTAVAKLETLPAMAVSHPATLASVIKRDDETEQNPDKKTKAKKAMKRDAARAARGTTNKGARRAALYAALDG